MSCIFVFYAFELWVWQLKVLHWFVLNNNNNNKLLEGKVRVSLARLITWVMLTLQGRLFCICKQINKLPFYFYYHWTLSTLSTYLFCEMSAVLLFNFNIYEAIFGKYWPIMCIDYYTDCVFYQSFSFLERKRHIYHCSKS